MSDSEKAINPHDARFLLPNWTPNDDLLKALGQLTIRYSYLQAVADQFLYWMVPISPENASLLLQDMTLGKLLGRIEAFSKKRLSASQMIKLKPILVRASELNGRRNKLVQALWSLPADRLTSATPRHSDTELPASAEDIRALNQDMLNVGLDLSKFLMGARGVL
jgi:hypothetical protein